MPATKPSALRVRMYQVGFGDCFLLTVEYAKPLQDGRNQRHVLIDFGSSHRAQFAPVDLPAIAQLIQEHTGGHLDVVVVTHRHKDHLSGFGNRKAAAMLTELSPQLVVRPWTENPKAPANATGPAKAALSFTSGLAAGQDFADKLADKLRKFKVSGVRNDLRAFADDQAPNQDAIDQLTAWGEAANATYAFAGADSGIETVVPGIKVTVLGPPTVEQWAEVATQRASDPEYWMLYQSLLTRGFGPGTLNTKEIDNDDVSITTEIEAITSPGPVRWLAEHLRKDEVHSLTRIVRALDDALNNTSIILMMEAGDTRLLFPGDAQIENWHYTLNRLPNEPDLRKRLSVLDLYKVGHHGSRNATPRSLYDLWCDSAVADHPMAALMSTRAGVHGESAATRVPRQTLVTALERRCTLYSTDDFPKDQLSLEVAADLKTHGPFELIEP